MAFDVSEYAHAIDEFLMKMEQIHQAVHSDTQPALDRICRLLRISLVEAAFYETSEKEASGEGRRSVLYSNGKADMSRVFCIRETADGGRIDVYKLYPIAGSDDWTDVEYEKIRVLAKMIYTFNCRIRAMHIAEELSNRDPDIGVYNLAYFIKTANELIAKQEIGEYAACYFNLKRFSVINRQIGRERGTLVIKLFAGNLQEKLGGREIVCRTGGDNFLVLFLKDHLEYVLEYLNGTEILYDEEREKRVMISAYAGYYMVPDECQTAADIMDCANVAMNIAKNVLRTSYAFYDEETVRKRNEAKAIESIFPSAIENEEFLVYYQPKVLLKDYKMAGAEALCRWQHDGKIVPPGNFIPVLEQSKAVCILDFYMLEHVCRDLRRWLDEGRKVVKVSVNLSRRHLGDLDLLENILSIVDRYRVPHEYIEIELTETTTDVDFQDLKKIVTGLRDQGIHTSVDDFGMGYSSLNLIRESPWNVIKIDKSFLPEGHEKTDEQKQIMLKYLITMFQDMGLACIVEGVETAEQIKLLKENNCYLAQGFYFDKPLPVEEFEKRLEELSAAEQ